MPSQVPPSKILLVSPSGVGGVQTFCANLAGGFKIAGYLPQVLFEDNGTTRESRPPLPSGVPSSVFSYSRFDNLCRVLKRMAEFIESSRFEFVYPNTSALAYRAIGLLGSRRPVAIGGCTGNNRHDYACNTEFADYLDHVFAVSSQGGAVLTERLAGRGIGVSVIPHGVKPAETSSARSFTGSLRLAFAGRFDAGKRLPDLVAVARRLAERGVAFSLTLVGDGPERQAVESACVEPEIQRRVRYPGLLSRGEVDHLMQESHVNLLLSESEGFGLSVLEGMSYGCVPIVTDTCGCKDAIEDGVNGFVVKLGDVEQVTARLQQLDRDRSCLARLSEASVRTAREKYSFENEIARHLGILSQAQEHHRRTAANTIPWNYQPTGLLNRAWVPNWLARSLRQIKYGRLMV